MKMTIIIVWSVVWNPQKPANYANELEREASVGFQRVEYIQAYFVVKATVYSEIHFVMIGINPVVMGW